MADYKGHINGALVAAGIYLAGLAAVVVMGTLYTRLTWTEVLLYPVALVALVVLFGLWPDVDLDSKGRRIFYNLFFAVDLFLIITERFEAAAYLGLFALLPALGAHRGWTHTWWAMLLVPAPLLVAPYLYLPETPLIGLPFYGAAVMGYFSHLLLDGLVLPSKWFTWRRQ
jgi:membrane-bound metal-dependent hydrolase YbcI (DUF457 family)